MSKAVFSDFRSDDNTDALELQLSKEKLCMNDNNHEARRTSLRDLPDQPKDDGSVEQNGHDGKAVKFSKRTALSSVRRRALYQRKLQNYCYKFLEQPSGWHNVYHVVLVLLVLTSLVMTVLSTVETENSNYKETLHPYVLAVEILLVLVFVLEYVVRLWSAGCCSCYVGCRGRIKFAVEPYAILDIIVIISSFLALGFASQDEEAAVEVIRFIPLLRVLRFDRQGGTWKLLGSVIYVHRKEMLTTLYLGFISLILASFVMYLSEKHLSGDFKNWPDSFWWGIVTLTTVGYGDKVPETWHGKLLAALFAVCGISFFALPAGILGSGFALKVTQQQRQKHFHRRRRPAAILLQSYWRLYCADINSKSVATWLPHIYYNRQQESLQLYMERGNQSGQTGLTVPESPSLSDAMSPLHRRKRSARGSKPKNDVKGARSDSVLVNALAGGRKASTCTLENEFLDVSKSNFCGSNEAIVTLSVPGPPNSDCTVIFSKKDVRHGSVSNEDDVTIVAPADGDVPIITLTNAQKHAICLIRLLKLLVAVRKFKEARRPYDVKDVMEQYSAGHVEMLSRIKNLQIKLNRSLGIKGESGDEYNMSRGSVIGRLVQVENQVQILDHKLDTILQILQSRTKNPCCSILRGSGDGNSGSHGSVTRTYSDPSESGTRASMTSDDAFSVTPRTLELTPTTSESSPCIRSPLLQAGASGAEGIDRLESPDIVADHRVNAGPDEKQLSASGKAHRQGLADKRQLSDVTETEEGTQESSVGIPEDVPNNARHSLKGEEVENVDFNEGATENVIHQKPPSYEKDPQKLPGYESGNVLGGSSDDGPGGSAVGEDTSLSSGRTRSGSAKRTLQKSPPIRV